MLPTFCTASSAMPHSAHVVFQSASSTSRPFRTQASGFRASVGSLRGFLAPYPASLPQRSQPLTSSPRANISRLGAFGNSVSIISAKVPGFSLCGLRRASMTDAS